MLELDRLHRTKNPRGSLLAAKLHWLAADALGCAFARACAEADLKRAGLTEPEFRQWVKDPLPAERGLCSFARKLTVAAYTITDEEFAALLKENGPQQMTAVVHTVAYANFLDRILLALDVRADADGPAGPFPPPDVRLDAKGRAQVKTPARPAWEQVAAAKPARSYHAPAGWKPVGYSRLEEALAAQQARKARVPLPEKSRFAKLPADVKRQAETIAWMTVSLGYQPELTQAWFACLREFRDEAKLERVFSSSLFWVVTRANECFY
jgi:hypothetical protein